MILSSFLCIWFGLLFFLFADMISSINKFCIFNFYGSFCFDQFIDFCVSIIFLPYKIYLQTILAPEIQEIKLTNELRIRKLLRKWELIDRIPCHDNSFHRHFFGSVFVFHGVQRNQQTWQGRIQLKSLQFNCRGRR